MRHLDLIYAQIAGHGLRVSADGSAQAVAANDQVYASLQVLIRGLIFRLEPEVELRTTERETGGVIMLAVVVWVAVAEA